MIKVNQIIYHYIIYLRTRTIFGRFSIFNTITSYRNVLKSLIYNN